METVKQHRARFVGARLVEYPRGWVVETFATRTGRTYSSRILSTEDSMDADWEYKKAANFLQANPGVRGHLSMMDVEHWYREKNEEERIRYGLYWERVLAIKYEVGLDWDDLELNDFTPEREAANAEYNLARDWAAEIGGRRDFGY